MSAERKKGGKAGGYLLSLALLVLVSIFILQVIPMTTTPSLSLGITEKELPDKTPIPTSTPRPTIQPTPTPRPPVTLNEKCLICHDNPYGRKAHKEGGNYCGNCHKAGVHDLHEEKIFCDVCHGESMEVPSGGIASICESCHDPNDMLMPQSNILEIHKNRFTCTDCHIEDLELIHTDLNT